MIAFKVEPDRKRSSNSRIFFSTGLRTVDGIKSVEEFLALLRIGNTLELCRWSVCFDAVRNWRREGGSDSLGEEEDWLNLPWLRGRDGNDQVELLAVGLKKVHGSINDVDRSALVVAVLQLVQTLCDCGPNSVELHVAKFVFTNRRAAY